MDLIEELPAQQEYIANTANTTNIILDSGATSLRFKKTYKSKYNIKPNISNIIIFSSTTYYKVKNPKPKKLNQRAKNIYRVYTPP
jgi:hypothetical protein